MEMVAMNYGEGIEDRKMVKRHVDEMVDTVL